MIATVKIAASNSNKGDQYDWARTIITAVSETLGRHGMVDGGEVFTSLVDESKNDIGFKITIHRTHCLCSEELDTLLANIA